MTQHFPRLFLWHVVRQVRRHRLLALLNVLSVALGMAVYLAIQIANHSANRSFAAGIDLVAGKSHLEVRGDVDELLWPRLAKHAGVRAVTGLVEGVVTLPDFPGEYLRVLGIDIFSSEPFRTFQLSEGGARLALESWLGKGDGLAVTADFARRVGVKVGDPLRVLVNSEIKTLTILSLLDTKDSPGASQSRIAAMDLGWGEAAFGKVGRLASLQILLDDPNRGVAIAGELQQLLPPDLTAAPPRQRSFQVQSMLAAFQLNLTALSMVSLLVGVFLIYNTISASVTRRRVEIGILRSIGATRWEIRALFLGEACLFGVPGIVLGAFGGVALAQVLTGAVAKTISSLYCWSASSGHFSIPRNSWSRPSLASARCWRALGCRRTKRRESIPWPRSASARMPSGASPKRPGGAGSRCGARGRGLVAWSALTVAPPVASFVAAFLVLGGFSLFAPDAVRRFGELASGGMNGGVLWRLAADNLRRSIHRNAVTVAALAAAIAMMVGLTVMIFSFRKTVSAWSITASSPIVHRARLE